MRFPKPNPPTSRKRQQGVVIVVALFIVALVATMAYVMMARLARDTKRVELVSHDVQAELYADGSVLWAKDVLHNNWIKQKKDHRVDATPIKSPANDMHGYKIATTIYDAQGKFNLNNLSKPEWHDDFIRCMRIVYPKITQEAAKAVVQATMDWIMPGARDNEYSRYYAELPIPYRAAHRLLADPSEWQLVKGVTPDLYKAMKPYITALPEVTPINPMAAEPQVMIILSPIMTLEAAKSLQDLLKKNPPPTIAAFKALDFVKNHPVIGERITWTSTYFLVETEVNIEEQRILLYTLMQRMSGNPTKADIVVLWQNRGSG